MSRLYLTRDGRSVSPGAGFCRLTVMAMTVWLSVSPARADEQSVPLASGGDWVALAHKASLLAAPDACLAANMLQGVLFRAGQEGMEFRVFNDKWSLPTNVEGTITISVGTFSEILKITGNTDTRVDAEISEIDLSAMFSAMDKASAMSLIVGKAKPLSVSLAGSTRATNAFRVCAGMKGNEAIPGANPFK